MAATFSPQGEGHTEPGLQASWQFRFEKKSFEISRLRPRARLSIQAFSVIHPKDWARPSHGLRAKYVAVGAVGDFQK